jgi:hypothetical protein
MRRLDMEEEKKVETGRRICIPDEFMERVVMLVDAHEKERSRLTNYRLWKFIEEIVPETRCGEWRMGTGTAVHYFVEESL